MNAVARARSVGGELAAPVKALAQAFVERAVERAVMALDMNAVLEQVDIAVIQKVDLEAVTDRLDMNAIVQRVDVDALVQQTDLAAIIARSSGGIAGGALDVARSQAVGLDEFTARWAARLRRRTYPGPPGPTDSLKPEGGSWLGGATAANPPAVAQVSLQGRYVLSPS